MSPPSRTCRHQTLRHCDPFTKTGRRSFDTANWRLNRRDFARLAPAPGRDCCNISGRRFLRQPKWTFSGERSCDGCMRGRIFYSRPVTFAVSSDARWSDETRNWRFLINGDEGSKSSQWIEVPSALEPIVSRTLSRRRIAHGWDGLLRLAASTQAGWCSAVWAVERHSSASIGMPVYEAGETLGKLQRSVFLCDYFGRHTFRQEIQRLLSRIESMHTLQRAIHAGPISPRRGRTREQMAAISGALTLLTNIVIA